jgi:hypothetical protein
MFFTRRWVLRRFEDVFVQLAKEGHEVVLARPDDDARRDPKRLRVRPNVRREKYQEAVTVERGYAVALLRHTRDYLWYLSDEQRVGSFTRRRALNWLVDSATAGTRQADPSWPDPIVRLGEADRLDLDRNLAALEDRIPSDPGVLELVRNVKPDAVLVSPLVTQRYRQTEVVKAARELGIPSGLLVYSWDNLSNKGRIHVPPDRVYVWNDLQRWEAETLHGIDPATIVLTGAPHWDKFFAMTPSITREELCGQYGFDPARQIVLYLGSTKDVAPRETVIVERWLEAVRARIDANILIRRHPGEQPMRWGDWAPKGERVALSADPHAAGNDLYDELTHADAAVGLNTSAQIEASIVGTPVYTFSGGADAPGQEGSLHFYYLLRERGGVVQYGQTLDEHVEKLQRGLAGEVDRDAIRAFAESFVRPNGLDRPVAPQLAEEIRKLASA